MQSTLNIAMHLENRKNANNFIFMFTTCSSTPCTLQDQAAITTPNKKQGIIQVKKHASTAQHL